MVELEKFDGAINFSGVEVIDTTVITSVDEGVSTHEDETVLSDLKIVVAALEEVFIGIEANLEQFIVVGDILCFGIVDLTDGIFRDSRNGLIEVVHYVKVSLRVMLA